ncbi:Uncharacterized protein dnm_050100 [Desulfonema magnum]|uniref:Uncharacterized protein n=1 Tax=Desulfonema magnum TaxID=45655 RepID=A0A975GPL8_9BACT|nr:Uncharacterized protein dnm_050100 [Desulfonema magnum]
MSFFNSDILCSDGDSFGLVTEGGVLKMSAVWWVSLRCTHPTFRADYFLENS